LVLRGNKGAEYGALSSAGHQISAETAGAGDGMYALGRAS